MLCISVSHLSMGTRASVRGVVLELNAMTHVEPPTLSGAKEGLSGWWRNYKFLGKTIIRNRDCLRQQIRGRLGPRIQIF